MQLSSPHSSVVLGSSDHSVPALLYWGDRCDFSEAEFELLARYGAPPIPQGGLDERVEISLFPTLGEGVFEARALEGHRPGGQHWAPQFHWVGQEGSRFLLRDVRAELEAVLEVVLHPENILELGIELSNRGQQPYHLQRLALSLVVPAWVEQLTQFHGRWVQEFQSQTSLWDQPGYMVENLKGRTSHDNPSLLLLAEKGCREEEGRVFAFHLGWSGNHFYRLQTLKDGRRLVQFGEALLPGEVILAPGQSYRSPRLWAGYSSRGMGQSSRDFHQLIRRHLLKLRRPERPVQFNSWEALYFDHTWERLVALVDRAAELGVERFVLDDGWFQGRVHDRAGLGDWTVDRHKYPQGLDPLIQRIQQQGMQFGLWLEPEMVNCDSELFRQHPEWILGQSGYRQPLGRHQYALNLDHPQAYQYIWECLLELLRRYPIDYLKWDMNRDLVQASSGQGQAGVRNQVLACYRLMAGLQQAFPHLEIESCASGGGRVDLGILPFCQRFWPSDCNDPGQRQVIQANFSAFFPPEIMGCHVGPQRAHTTHRQSDLECRLITAFFGHLGFEWDLTQLTPEEMLLVGRYVGLYREHRHWLHRGQWWRGPNAWGVLDRAYSAGEGQAARTPRGMFALFQPGMPRWMIPPPLTLPGFEPERIYQAQLLSGQANVGYVMKQVPAISQGPVRLSGRLLAQVGLQLPIMHPESAQLLLVQEEELCT